MLKNNLPIEPLSIFRQPLLDYLLETNLINQDQQKILQLQQLKNNGNLAQIITDLNIIPIDRWLFILADYTGVDIFDPVHHHLNPDVYSRISRAQLELNHIIPLNLHDNKLRAVVTDPEDVRAFDRVLKYFPNETVLIPLLVTEPYFNQMLDTLYNDDIALPVAPVVNTSFQPVFDAIKFVDDEIAQAIKFKVSDIHFEPHENMIQVRHRIDGILRPGSMVHAVNWSAICVRIKIMAGMNIAESRLPQDGHFNLKIAGRFVDFRVAVHPTLHGENIVIRILDKLHALKSLDQLGFDHQQIGYLKKLVHMPHGLIIFAGPTGSGKTTTLYSLLQYICSQTLNIMTLEDPIEYEIAGIRQTEIKELGGITYADGVRSILRQDPDVILIGEIRDQDTAQMAMRAAMTGHLVLTTLHANDSWSAIYRLMDLGVSATVLANNLVGIAAQRLIRLSCTCQQHQPNTKAQGCPQCSHTGFKGRRAVGEVLILDENLQEMITAQKSIFEMKRYVHQHDFTDLKTTAANLVQCGLTVSSEIQRVIREF